MAGRGLAAQGEGREAPRGDDAAGDERGRQGGLAERTAGGEGESAMMPGEAIEEAGQQPGELATVKAAHHRRVGGRQASGARVGDKGRERRAQRFVGRRATSAAGLGR